MKPTTMREFDALCLPKIKELSPSEIKQIRLREKLSQAVFAAYLNTTSTDAPSLTHYGIESIHVDFGKI